jgi:DNA/RNA-binding domain of Phe-tRNA-synthetase-like protein
MNVLEMGLQRPFHKSPRATAYGIPAGFLVVRALTAQRDPAVLQAVVRAYLSQLLTNTTLEAVLKEPRLAGYRALHTMIGKTGRHFIPAPESQFRQLFKRGAWRSLGGLIDCYNLIALQTRVSIGAHDLAHLTLPVTLDSMAGGELLQAIGEASPVPLTRGEYAYRDAAGHLLGRLECRQSNHSRVTAATREVLFIVQGHAALGIADIRATCDTLLSALHTYYGTWSSAELTLAD